MKLQNVWKVFFVLTFLGVAGLAQAQQQVMTEKQTKQVACAKEKIYALYNFFNYEKTLDQRAFTPSECGTVKNPIEVPKWLQDGLPEMSRNMIWRQTAGNGQMTTLNEAQMWQRAFGIIYEFFSLVENINQGTAFTAQEIMEKFGMIRTRLLITTDAINSNEKFYESMGGRGRQMIASFELINKEMLSVGESFVVTPKKWRPKFRKAVVGVAILSNTLYSEITRTQGPVPVPPNYRRSTGTTIVLQLLLLAGAFLIFLSVLIFVNDRSDKLSAVIEEYLQKSSVWADDYSRQFITINIKYIVIGTVLFFSILGLFFGLTMGGFFGIIVFMIFFAAGLYFGLKMPGVVLDILKRRRGEKINKQLMDALILLSNSLKSGMDIVQGFEMVSHDLQPPISEEFALIIKNYNLGTPFERALEGMEERVESRLLSYMVKAIILQRQVGGNLTKIFERIVENIREESKLEEKLQAMTAQQRIQSIVVGIVPWIMVGIMFVFQPDTMISFYTSKVGFIVFLLCVIWIFIGIKLVNKLGRINV